MGQLWVIIHKFGWLLILVLALTIRLWGLGLNPVGLTHDEIHDLMNAKSLAMTGNQVPGTVAGVLTGEGYCNGNCVFGEFASFGLVPWMKIFPLDIFWSKIPFVLAGLGMVFWGGKLFENLSGSKKVGMVVMGLLAINPWMVHFGRTAYENLFSFSFYLWALSIFTWRGAGKKEVVAGLILGFFGFLSYFGVKPIYVPLMLVGLGYWFWNHKQKERGFLVTVVTGMILVVLIYGWGLKNSQAGVRLGELKLADQEAAQIVNDERRQSLDMYGWERLVINKGTVMAKQLIDRYLGAFEPNYYFNRQESGDFFAIPNQPYFFLIDGVFIILGLVVISKKRGPLMMVELLILLAPMASVVNINMRTYALRSWLIFPVLIGVGGWGLTELLRKTERRKKIVIAGLVGVIYALSWGYFQMNYWYRMPYAKSGGWSFHERVLTSYIKRYEEISDKPLVVKVKDRVDVAYLYAFYTGKYNKVDFIKYFNEAAKKTEITLGQVTFSNSPEMTKDKNVVYEPGWGKKGNDWTLSRIVELRDNGDKFIISNDVVCKGMEQPRYGNPRSLADFEVEKMSNTEFCKKWIVKF